MLQFRQTMEEQGAPIVFSELLKHRRRALDITQEELAKRASCSVSALRKIESGDRRPSKQLATLLAKALEIPIEDQQIFIRVARGELNIERLGRVLNEPLQRASDGLKLQQTQREESLVIHPTPPSDRIPLQATPLIGRDIELAAMSRIFLDPQCRLLTLTGVGGIGKTRLAIEFAASNSSAFPGGVYYIPLTPVYSPEEIVPAIADVLDLVFSGPFDPKRQLITYISSNIKQAALFVFDNLEQLLVPMSTRNETSGLVELVSEILQQLPNVKILGTSRERLNLHGEWTYEVHGLSVPPDNFVGRLEEYNSVSLFVRSAQRIKADFQITVDEQLPITQVCQLVDGVPLAIELAAAWVGILSCREIAQEIQSNMDFLTTSMRDIPERHRSIRATFDHSWKLLSGEECNALCQLSIFHGGFDRHAANMVAGASLPLLASLSAKSLVRRTESGRYDLHEVIRQYAQSHINDLSGDLEPYERHCEYYLAYLGNRGKPLKTILQQETVRQLTDEIDNIRAAWAWAINHHKFAQLAQAGRAFGWYFEISGLYHEGIEQFELLEQTLRPCTQDNHYRRLLGLALIHQALLHFRIGEFDRARNLYEESANILRPTGDKVLLADALIYLGTILHLAGEYPLAQSTETEGLLLARAVNERWFEAYAILNLGYVSSLMGNYEKGCEQMLAGLGIWRQLGDPQSIALALNFLVPTLIKLGRYEEAKINMHESITLCEQSKNRWGLGTAYRYLGLAYLAGSQYGEAKAHLVTSLEIFGEHFIGWDIARSLTYLGDANLKSGDLSAAKESYLDGLRSAIEAKAIPIALDALLGLDYLQEKAGKTYYSLMLCYFLLDHPASDEETKNRAEQLRAELEIKLNNQQVMEARTMATEMSFDELVKTVLQFV
jgi:predicted ATPase/transcriptional regulator with XRE-family HTH domain